MAMTLGGMATFLAGCEHASSAPLIASTASTANDAAEPNRSSAGAAPSIDTPEPKAEEAVPTKAPGCVEAAQDALSRYRRRTKEPSFRGEAHVERVGDLDGDGSPDTTVRFSESCGAHVGCNPYYLYLRTTKNGARCDRFVGAFDGDVPALLSDRHHGLRDLRVALPGLYGESEWQLAFDGSRYLRVAERERDRKEVDRPWGRWSTWKRFPKGVSAEGD